MKGYPMKALILLLMCALAVACVNRGNLRVERAGEALDIFHAGKMIEQQHTKEARWGTPGGTSSVTCYPSQLTYDDFWGIPTCPGTTDKNAPLSVEVGRVQTASYKDLVIPSVITGLFQVAAFGTLGAVMPAPKVDVRQTNTVSGSPVRTSTLLINAPVPGGVAP